MVSKYDTKRVQYRVLLRDNVSVDDSAVGTVDGLLEPTLRERERERERERDVLGTISITGWARARV